MVSEFGGDVVFRPRGETVRRVIAGETILVPIRGRTADMQSLFALNPTATFIWERVDGTRSIEQILVDILAAFEVEREEAREHLLSFLTLAQNQGLVEEID